MQQYTLTGIAKRAVSIPDPLIMLGPGYNAFSVFTDDLSSVLQLLAEEGVEVREVNELGLDPVTPEDSMLPGETRASLQKPLFIGPST